MEIERNEIVKNELPIKNFEQLSYSIYQDEYVIENEKVANECVEYLTENLKKVYDFLEDKELSEDIDLYQIGDVINFLETIKIVKEK